MAEGRTNWPAVADDWFVEPSIATTFLLDREAFDGRIWDPACGQGNLVEACLARGLDAVGTDLRTRFLGAQPPWFLGERDFLQPSRSRIGARHIVTNPPYGHAKLAEAFIRRALAMRSVDKVAVFVNGKFLFGSGRAKGLYAEHPPTRIYPINPRPSCPPGEFLRNGGKAAGGVENFVWLVFCRGATGTELCW